MKTNVLRQEARIVQNAIQIKFNVELVVVLKRLVVKILNVLMAELSPPARELNVILVPPLNRLTVAGFVVFRAVMILNALFVMVISRRRIVKPMIVVGEQIINVFFLGFIKKTLRLN